MNNGYIALFRQIRENPLWKKPVSRVDAWIDILMEVRYKEGPQEVLIGWEVVECHYAQSIKSVRTWADRWGWSESRVRRFFGYLEKQKMVEREALANTTRLTVVNYKKYDDARRTRGEPPTDARRTADELPTTEEEGKEGKEGKARETEVREPQPMDTSLAPGAENSTAYHKDYLTVLDIWKKCKKGARVPKGFQKAMVDALNNGCKRAAFETAFREAKINEPHWELQARVIAAQSSDKPLDPYWAKLVAEGRT